MESIEPLSKADVDRSLKRIRKVWQELSSEFVAKEEIIEMMLICAIAQEPMVIFGEPGTAKSALISKFREKLRFEDQDYFEYLLTSFTEPDELMGVVDINEYITNKKYKRVGSGGIQHAKIIFLDEVFRGNSAILNTLLSIINERVYFEGGQRRSANTQVVYGASNDAPTSTDLRAFYSRFPIRMYSQRVSEIQPKELLEKGWNLEMESLAKRALRKADNDNEGENNSKSALSVKKAQVLRPSEMFQGDEASCSLQDLQNLQTWLRQFWAPAENKWGDRQADFEIIKIAYLDIINRMNRYGEQFKIDDRKVIKLFKLIIAHAMLTEGANCMPTLTDLWAVLRHTWEDPELANLAGDNITRFITEVQENLAGQLSQGLFFDPEKVKHILNGSILS